MANKPHASTGTDIDVFWDGRLCIHVEECVRAHSEVFEKGRKPWAMPDAGPAEEAAEVCERCPTGAMTYVRKDGGPQESAPDVNTVVIANDGPLYLSGDLEIEGAGENMEGVSFRAALCRCGESSKKPFCDGSHANAEFADSGAVGNASPGAEGTGGPLSVKLAKDGPLLLAGNFRLVTGPGRVAWEGSKAALCRCGKSANKPFCDGTHKAAGFKSD
ncbi:MAG: hypothetical protein HKN29_16060 [Rhodothermales bacterium]|nr:hypothetical protein [Rhodothermales bacterium]